MKKIILSALVAILILASCQEQKPTFTLTGKLNSNGEKTLVVNVLDGTNFNALDTLVITDGVINYSTTLESPLLMVIGEDKTRNSVSFFADNSAYTISGNVDSLNVASITGGAAYDLYKKITDSEQRIAEVSRELRPKFAAANQAGDTAKANAIYDEYMAEAQKVDDIKAELVKANPTSPVSAFVVYNMYRHGSLEEMKEGLAQLDSTLTANSYYKALMERVALLETVAVGKEAPEFTQNDAEGNPVALSSFKGKYLLVDFWASWCGPCRGENPNVVKLYADYKDKGFDILGISLDQKKDAWLKAIEEDQLAWNHVSDLKGWGNEVAKLYGVSSIPHTILLDKEGKIIAKNLRGEELRAKIAELLD
ncbi:TlpA disulfide reductase family protein [Plebeiibacterium sediminum]|uniref:AhpC/TSA family protein n=1 Tax=Plebeiibacterium sediminum TaxID=2992112 RepID=A0AAE3M8H0_9BACT|nr:TlpA disulfide reductase family protein [Plebeiobacterium sediminum]MCW3788814.1 AhpC/TSA family protein [Plebeiobacterium sediminum]